MKNEELLTRDDKTTALKLSTHNLKRIERLEDEVRWLFLWKIMIVAALVVLAVAVLFVGGVI